MYWKLVVAWRRWFHHSFWVQQRKVLQAHPTAPTVKTTPAVVGKMWFWLWFCCGCCGCCGGGCGGGCGCCCCCWVSWGATSPRCELSRWCRDVCRCGKMPAVLDLVIIHIKWVGNPSCLYSICLLWWTGIMLHPLANLSHIIFTFKSQAFSTVPGAQSV